MLDCDEEAFSSACYTIYKPGYYATERFDTSTAPTDMLHRAIAASGIRVAVDGTGGDEIFHGYRFRDDFRAIPEWPRSWLNTPQYYSIYSTLLDYTAKAEKSGAFYSVESRFPYQSSRLFKAAMKLPRTRSLKWPLRKFLADELPDYGKLTDIDKNGKYGFSLKNKDKHYLLDRLLQAWANARPITSPVTEPKPFPFKIGRASWVQAKDAICYDP
jgi:asparagine synthetase B (glutamine-hydrolysing)